MSMRFRSSANFHSTIICSPKNWMNWDMQPAGWVIYRVQVVANVVIFGVTFDVSEHSRQGSISNQSVCFQTFISGYMQRLILVTLQVGQAVTSPFPVGGRMAFLSS